MKDFTFIHTNWTAPAFNNRWSVGTVDQIINNIWYYSLSAAYLKRINQQINLHTDSFGKMCLDHIPYDNIYLTLDSIPKYIKPYMWAYGKFHALNKCQLNTIHIDGDVFIKSHKCINRIKYLLSNNCDVITQCHETTTNNNGYGLYESTSYALKKLKYPQWGKHNGCDALNTGFLLFNNQTLKDEYLKEYMRCAYDCCNDKKLVTVLHESLNDKEGICPDLVLEQQFLYDAAHAGDYKIGLLINYNDLNNSANRINYQHIIGKGKYSDTNMSMCKKTLFTINKELYYKTLDKVNYIKEYLTKHAKH